MIEVNRDKRGRAAIVYIMTLACNNRCPYCFMLDKLDNDLKFNHEVFEQFKKAFNELDRTNEIELTLSGGEPFFVDEIQRIKELDLTNTELSIFSNLNYSGDVFRERLDLLDGVDYVINCSFHETSNTDDVRSNVLYLHNNSGNVDVSLFVNPENLLRIKEHAEFFKQNGVPYTIIPLRDTHDEGMSFNSDDFGDNKDIFEELLSTSETSDTVSFGDRQLTEEEIYRFNIQDISHVYYTQCELNIPMVNYDGDVTVRCQYNYRSHISEGLLPQKMVLCSNKSCSCTLATYKRLLRPKDKDANKELHEYFGY